MKRLNNYRSIHLLACMTLIFLLVWIVAGLFRLFPSDVITSFRTTSLRFFLATIFIYGLYLKGYPVFHMEKKSLYSTGWLIIPAFIVSLNNFPWHVLYNGSLNLNVGLGVVVLFFIECLSIGIFEEVLFRYVIFVIIMQLLTINKKNVFLGMVLSSVLFGLFHLINLFAGAGVGETLQQVGYTTLLGLLWSMTLFLTQNIWVPILLHTIYNFVGVLYFRYGSVSTRFDLFTIIVTIIVAVITTIFYVKQFKSMSLDTVETLINP
ncbi:MAG: CPBP family intramembrane glutamic endopeptidase [Candidatus Izemoplasma sp.]|nr:CPBP family intramembrane glutamic endopeptidase [Candidatus Izemoplasma sp.]